ncbi:MAG TPA: type II toxin-antitoxin system HicB family antitoxin [Candidatus Saccharimonadales bacterium]|nr:type II toxin-antitoxin system HicB family antitoxin [Candidatus Saccharimonadales bacterium]
MKDKILKYDVIFEEQPDSGYTVTVPSLPGCISEGDTFEQAKENITDAIRLYLEDLDADGVDIPQGNTSIFVGQVSVYNPLLH